MRKGLLVVGTLVVMALALLVVRSRWPDAPAVTSPPQVIRVLPREVTLVWQTDVASLGRVRYRPVGSDAEPLMAKESPPSAPTHELTVTGLEPGTRYRYGLGNGELAYSFETQPLPTAPFSLLLTWGDVAERIEALMASQAPGAILSITPVGTKDGDPFAAVRSEVPVFGPGGPTSTLVDLPAADRWVLDWAGLRLVVLGQEPLPTELLEGGEPHTVGLVLPGDERTPRQWSESSLHRTLVDHNAAARSGTVPFVLAAGSSAAQVEADGIVYLGVPSGGTEEERAGALRLDVGPSSTVAVFVDSDREVVLRQTGLRRRRTCKECRELADRGAYEKSVRAYEQFIADNEGHYQIDDAHFAIAEILDERLFRHAEALRWYDELIAGYPDSTLVPLARQRVSYLREHDDHDFEPLARFERIRKVELARHKDDPAKLAEVLTEVRRVIDAFPDSTLAPQMRYWLANQYRAIDPDRAVATYRELIETHPDYPGVQDGWIEIGETYYLHRRYAEAIEAFEQARAAVPERAEAIEAQLGRAQRNQRRGRLAWIGWLYIVGLVAAGAALRRQAPPVRELRAAVVAFLPLSALLLLGGWLIHEQFKSALELLGLAVGIAVAASFGHPFAASLAARLLPVPAGAVSKGRVALAAAASFALGLIFFAAGTYLAVYHLNEHYLTTVGL